MSGQPPSPALGEAEGAVRRAKLDDCSVPDGNCAATQECRYFSAIALRASATTTSTVKPKNFNKSFNGAEAPNRCIPTFRPFSPTYRSQPKVAAISTETRAVTEAGSTLSLYAASCCSKISHDGMLTTLAAMPSALSFS